jgi:hypothetical protein
MVDLKFRPGLRDIPWGFTYTAYDELTPLTKEELRHVNRGVNFAVEWGTSRWPPHSALAVPTSRPNGWEV